MGSRHLPATVLALVIALGAVATDPPPARAAEDQLRDSAVTTYELQPSRGVIHVTVSYTLTNKAPSKSKRYPCTGVGFDPWYGYYTYATTCTRRTDYYYFSYWVWVEKDARAVKVKGSSGTASVKLGKVDGNWRKATMKFSPLWYGKTRKLTLSYDLPAGGARSDADRRVGYVHSAFCAYGPSAERGELRIVAPAGYAFTPSLAMTSSSSGGKVVLASGTLKSKPWTFGGCVRGYNSDGFDTTTLETTGGRAVTVEAWRDDSTWAANVRDATEALSALEAFLGTDGLSPALTIREVLGNGQPNGDPAVYNPLAGTLNVSESLIDRATMVDELTGTWFDKTVFPAGWLRYGYIRWAEHEAGVLDASCDEPGPKPGGGALDLSLWGYYRGLTDELVAYKLQAACWIVRQVNSAIGPAGVEATLTAIREGRDAFSSADAMSDRNAKLLMWRDWLDIVTERGLIPAGADPDLAADLLVEYGVTPDRDEMTAHGAARDAYHALRDLAGGPVPAFITDALARWDFETAQSAIDAAT